MTRFKIFFVLTFFLIIISAEIIILAKQGADTSIILSQSQKVDTSQWRTYQNRDFGFEIKYPQDWLSGTKERIDRKTGEIAIQEQYTLSSGVISFNIVVNEDSPETLYFIELLEKLPKHYLPKNKFVYLLEESQAVYAIDEYFSVDGFGGIIFYSNHKRTRLISLPIMDEAILKGEENIFYFFLVAEQGILLQENKDIFKQILSTFKFIE